ncbi:TatD DNase family protein [Pseudidiomarina indica]|uniref:TatD DNase family protein n=1 Tax=Pseudidiomarina indica TaxID=1159017 RepID=A0A1G6E2T8_9GAMM|nr:TatD family hydrolase [Pseudidiomarina indica]SDB51275.1 TatD DNase family protein [Pseudidiomarina indica]
MKLIDSHCHINFDAFEGDRQQVVQRALDVGIKALVVPGVSRQQSSRTEWLHDCQNLRLIQGVGLHPYFINEHQPSDLEWVATQLQQNAMALVGEVGLDGVVPQVEKQHELFVAQLEMAIQWQRPLILHHRQSQAELLRLIQPVAAQLPPNPGILHAFSGSYEQAMAWVKLGFMLGVGGTITYPRAQKTRRALAQVPLEFLLLETDAPDMPLSGFQGQRNEPAQVVRVLDELSQLRQMPRLELAECLWRNAQRLFGLAD